MLLVSLHFWEGSTNTIQLRCVMLMPTLFDIDVITDLRPTGEVFDHIFDTYDIIGLNSKWTSFTNFIADHFDEATTEVSDEEHVAFLSLWLSHFIFCSNSLQMEKALVTLTN